MVCGGSRIAKQAVGAEGSGGCGSLGRRVGGWRGEQWCTAARGSATGQGGMRRGRWGVRDRGYNILTNNLTSNIYLGRIQYIIKDVFKLVNHF